MSVAVGGTGVSVLVGAGAGVSVGTAVAVGGTGVSVLVGAGASVSVGTVVDVDCCVGLGVLVAVAGALVSVGDQYIVAVSVPAALTAGGAAVGVTLLRGEMMAEATVHRHSIERRPPQPTNSFPPRLRFQVFLTNCMAYPRTT